MLKEELETIESQTRETSRTNSSVPNDQETLKPRLGGSVIVDKINEPFKVVLNAYNNHITPQIEIPKKL